MLVTKGRNPPRRPRSLSPTREKMRLSLRGFAKRLKREPSKYFETWMTPGRVKSGGDDYNRSSRRPIQSYLCCRPDQLNLKFAKMRSPTLTISRSVFFQL